MKDLEYLAYWILALIAFRLLARLTCRRLFRGRESSFGLPFLLLAITYVYWIIGSLMRLPEGVGFLVTLILAVSFALWAVDRRWPGDTENSSGIGGDVVFWIAFLFALGLRGFIPELELGEKFADLAVFQTTIHGRSFPPDDLWLTGHSLNYYYFGQLLFVPLVRLTSVPIEWAVNFSTCTIFAMMATGSYGAVRWFGGPRRVAILSVAILSLFSNWHWIHYLMYSNSFGRFWWWDSSRAITNTITEFPYFSFLLGDFHAHFIAIPWLILPFLLTDRLVQFFSDYSTRERWGLAGLVALTLGVHYPLNPWGLPFLAILVTLILSRKIWLTAGIGIGSFVFYLPFWLGYERPGSAGLLVWLPRAYRSSIFEFSLHWGLFLVPLFFFLILHFPATRWKRLLIAGAVSIPFSAFIGLSFGLVVFLAALFVLSGILSLRNRETLLLAGAAFLIGFCELFSVDVTYGGKLLRLNTVFKFYTMAWWCLAMAVPLLFWRHPISTQIGRRIGYGLLAICTGMSLVYTGWGLNSRVGSFARKSFTLDGMAHWKVQLPDERPAVDWIRANTNPDDVIWERYGPGYHRYSRFTTFAGRPTILGWFNHEQVWRKTGYQMAQARVDEFKVLYGRPSPETVDAFFAKHNVKWFVVGTLEREVYPPALLKVLAKYPLAFQTTKVSVHRASNLLEGGDG